MNEKTVTIRYTNWKGETKDRHITPKIMFWGSTNYHQELQWLLMAFDEDKQLERIFAMRDIQKWE